MSNKIFKRRPVRISKACQNCRNRKVKCSGEPICSNCKRYGEQCIYRQHYRNTKPSINSVEADMITPPTSGLGVGTTAGLETTKEFNFPQFLSVTKSNSSSMEYFGPASNFSFINQLYHYLRHVESPATNTEIEDEGLKRFGLNLMVLSGPADDFDYTLSSISIEKVNGLLLAYLETWHVPNPILTAEELFDLSVKTWKQENATKYDKAFLYLILSIGATVAHYDTEINDTSSLARGFFQLALRTVPDIFSEASFNAVKIMFMMSLAACNLGDTTLSYLYSGYSVRTGIAIGLHKTTKFESLHCHRVWCSTVQWESYWSFCVGKPSSRNETIDTPSFSRETYTSDGYGDQNKFAIHYEHMRIRIVFSSICSKIQVQLYNSKNNLLFVLKRVQELSNELDTEYLKSDDPITRIVDIEDGVKRLDSTQCIEWFWIKSYYFYLKMMIYRPFMVFSAYLKNSKTHTNPNDLSRVTIIEMLREKSSWCVRFAIDFSRFIIDLTRRLKLRQPIFFICTYLESASTILLFYVISSIKEGIPDDLAEQIWDVLQDTCMFLSGNSQPFIGIKLIATDALKSLRNILMNEKSELSNKKKTFFDKVREGVVNSENGLNNRNGYVGNKNQLSGNNNLERLDAAFGASDLEDFWKQTLDWLSNN